MIGIRSDDVLTIDDIDAGYDLLGYGESARPAHRGPGTENGDVAVVPSPAQKWVGSGVGMLVRSRAQPYSRATSCGRATRPGPRPGADEFPARRPSHTRRPTASAREIRRHPHRRVPSRVSRPQPASRPRAGRTTGRPSLCWGRHLGTGRHTVQRIGIYVDH